MNGPLLVPPPVSARVPDRTSTTPALLNTVLIVLTPVPPVLRNVPALATCTAVPLFRISAFPSVSRSNVALGLLLNTAGALQLTCPAPAQLPAPPFTSVPPLKLLTLAPLIFRPPLATTARFEAVLPSVPTVQLNGPPSVSVPEPVKVPPLSAYDPLAELVPPSPSVRIPVV